jgi:membrane protease YdiL (CAAX protease family)
MTTLVRAIPLAAGILGLAFGVQALVSNTLPELVAAHPWIDQFTMKTTLVAASLGAIVLWNREGLAGSGFRCPQSKVNWTTVWAPAALMGASAAVVILLGGSSGLKPVYGNYGLGGIVFWIWVYSSITEEVFTRGWFQTYVAQYTRHAVAASAILFGGMHLSLISRVDPWALGVIITGATLLGWLTAVLRQRHGSLLPPLVAHVAFNVGGFLGGIGYTIAYRLATGELPN